MENFAQNLTELELTDVTRRDWTDDDEPLDMQILNNGFALLPGLPCLNSTTEGSAALEQYFLCVYSKIRTLRLQGLTCQAYDGGFFLPDFSQLASFTSLQTLDFCDNLDIDDEGEQYITPSLNVIIAPKLHRMN